jgi:hypothetical protein
MSELFMKKVLVYLLAGALLTGAAFTAEAAKQIAFGKAKVLPLLVAKYKAMAM